MAQQTVLIVGGRIETVRKAHELGLRVLYLQHPHRFTPEHAPLVHAALLADFTDWAAARPLIAGAHEAFGIDGVATLTEPGLIGDTVRPLAWSWDRPGQIIVTAPTTEAAVDRCEALAREITIVTG